MTTTALHAAALGEVSKSLQSLHHRLLKFQADELGFYGSPLQLFDRATKDPAFGWLKVLRGLIVAIDERRAADEPMTAAETGQFRDQCRDLIDAKSGVFRTKLNTAFQSDPETIGAISAVRKSLDT